MQLLTKDVFPWKVTDFNDIFDDRFGEACDGF